MDYLYSKLNESVEEVRYFGAETNTAVVTVDNANNVISVEVKKLSPSMLDVQIPTDLDNYVLVQRVVNNGIVYTWTKINDLSTNIVQMINAETNRAETAESELEQKISSEASLREEADQLINSNISKLSNEMTSSDASLNSYITSVNESLSNSISSIEQQSGDLSYKVDVIDASINDLTYNFNNLQNSTESAINSISDRLDGIEGNTAENITNIENSIIEINSSIQALQEESEDLTKRVSDIESTNVNMLQLNGNGKIEANINSASGRTFNVDIVDISDANNNDRFTVTLKNNDSISGYGTDTDDKGNTKSHKIAEVSKWNVVEIGASDLPLNLSTSANKITVNDGASSNGHDLLDERDLAYVESLIESTKSNIIGDASANYDTLGKIEDALINESNRAQGVESSINSAIKEAINGVTAQINTEASNRLELQSNIESGNIVAGKALTSDNVSVSIGNHLISEIFMSDGTTVAKANLATYAQEDIYSQPITTTYLKITDAQANYLSTANASALYATKLELANTELNISAVDGKVESVSAQINTLSNSIDNINKGVVRTTGPQLIEGSLSLTKDTSGNFGELDVEGNVTIGGNLTVSGTTVTSTAENLNVKNQMIITNADGDTIVGFSGLGIKTGTKSENLDEAYGIVYDSANNAVRLGIGTFDGENNFTFEANEGYPLAVRDYADNFSLNEVPVWTDDGKKFVASDVIINGAVISNVTKLNNLIVPEADDTIATVGQLETNVTSLDSKINTTDNKLTALNDGLLDGSVIVNRATNDALGNDINSTYETKTVVGAINSRLGEAEDNITELQSNDTEHTQQISNLQEADTQINNTIDGAIANLNNHISNTNNPHQVTKTQIGLSNVDNVRQYSASNPPPYGTLTFTGAVEDSFTANTSKTITIPTIAGNTPNITATATIDSNVGEPNVVVKKSGSRDEPILSFIFANLKGEPGEDAGFGDITANAVTLSAGEQATASVSNGGTNAEKTLSFMFGIPKGFDGARGENGYTYLPNVSDSGDLSWTVIQGSGSIPETVNIKGPKGDPISTTTASVPLANGTTADIFTNGVSGTLFIKIDDGELK